MDGKCWRWELESWSEGTFLIFLFDSQISGGSLRCWYARCQVSIENIPYVWCYMAYFQFVLWFRLLDFDTSRISRSVGLLSSAALAFYSCDFWHLRLFGKLTMFVTVLLSHESSLDAGVATNPLQCNMSQPPLYLIQTLQYAFGRLALCMVRTSNWILTNCEFLTVIMLSIFAIVCKSIECALQWPIPVEVPKGSISANDMPLRIVQKNQESSEHCFCYRIRKRTVVTWIKIHIFLYMVQSIWSCEQLSAMTILDCVSHSIGNCIYLLSRSLFQIVNSHRLPQYMSHVVLETK